MASHNDYKHPYKTDAGYEDAESDGDLALDELDPVADRPGTSRPQSQPNRDRSGSTGGIHLQRLRPGRHAVAARSPRRNKNTRYQKLSPEDDENEGLVSQAAFEERPWEDDLENATAVSPPRRPPNGRKLSQIWNKLKSTPQSEAEEGFDPSTNRVLHVGQKQSSKFPANTVSHAKYTPWSFLPRTLYNEFSFFFNLYFLLVALSQIIPALRIGYLSTYVAPLAFVITITLGKEAVDDISRRRRDLEANAESFTVVQLDFSSKTSKTKDLRTRRALPSSEEPGKSRWGELAEEEQQSATKTVNASELFCSKRSRDLRVGDILKLGKDQRIPADTIILKSIPADAGNEQSKDAGGEAFIRTDQLDGETDWKLRVAPIMSQGLNIQDFEKLRVNASKPEKNVNEFVGSLTLEIRDDGDLPKVETVPLTIDNTAWANTVLASSATVFAVVVYTGPQTRQALSTSASRSKTGLLEYEINGLTKILCALTLVLSLALVGLQRYETSGSRKWYIVVMRFLILFSTIVPISLRVNLDMGKSVYAWFIQRDLDIQGTVVRTSTIPEDLGRIEYLLTDKTGTLTQNDMQLKKIHVGTVSYANEAMSEVATYVRQAFVENLTSTNVSAPGVNTVSATSITRSRREIGSRVRDLVIALALCHNVTPTTAIEAGETVTTYQASSPDEIAILMWTEDVGLRLTSRDRHSMILESTDAGVPVIKVDILNIFPFTSESKRMGIILRFHDMRSDDDSINDTVWFFEKGADSVMSPIVASNDWLDEETANMAREGLRTLVVGRKKLSSQSYQDFAARHKEASLSLRDREAVMAKVVHDYLEQDLELLGVTGVEDKLQQNVKPSLELLRNAGIKIWMLTGDKVETARCVAISSKLVARGQYIHTIAKLSRKDQAQESLDFLRSRPDACLLIDGESLATMLTHHRESFISMAVCLAAVVACRCTPTQKADVAQLIRTTTKKRICCIGDGGNDVSMIQAADVGIGIVGKEGRQASLAADFSVAQFYYLTKLLVWHGRNSYKRSAKLAQFVIHRGLIISVCQTVFSVARHFEPTALYRDWLLVGYATVYTMFPVFSLVLDTDIPPRLAHVYPELYAELLVSRSLSYRTFLVWMAISVYQGCAIQLLSQALVGLDESSKMVSISYTALIFNELLMVAAEVTIWHWIMVVSIVGTAVMYVGSLPLLGEYFDLSFILTVGFAWRTTAIVAIALMPVWAAKMISRAIKPPNYRKVQQGL